MECTHLFRGFTGVLIAGFFAQGSAKANVIFAEPVDAGCLDSFTGGETLRLSGKDVYTKGFEFIKLCRHESLNAAAEPIAKAVRTKSYHSSGAGVFVEERGGVYFYPKTPARQPAANTEYVGPTTSTANPDAPFQFAVTHDNVAALTLGHQTNIHQRQSGGWQNIASAYAPLDRSKVRFGKLGVYTLDATEKQITWSKPGALETTILFCAEICEHMAATDTGLYVVSARSIYFFDATGEQSTVAKSTTAPWQEIYDLQANPLGFYLLFSTAQGRHHLVFFSNSGQATEVLSRDTYIDSFVGNEFGVFTLDRLVTGKWTYRQLVQTN